MDLELDGAVAVVTGASRGIGLAVTRALVDEGAHVVAGARSASPELTELAAAGRVEVVAVDLATAAGPATLVEAAAFLPDPGVIDYGAGKAALNNMAKALSKEVGPRGVRVTWVDPGPVATDLWLGAGGVADTVGSASGQSPDDLVAAAVAGTATGRFTRPDEVAALVVMLASGRAGNVTGAGITVDGGLVRTL